MDIDTTYMKSGGASRQIELPHACERHSLHEDDLLLTGFKVFIPQKKRFFIMAAQAFHIEDMKSALNGKEDDLARRGKRTAGENILLHPRIAALRRFAVDEVEQKEPALFE